MRLLLPPSEAKTPGGRGRTLRQRPFDGPLAEARARTTAALTDLVAGDPSRAAEVLLLPPGVADEALAANAAVLDCRTTPALRRYAGVVYDGLGYLDMPAAHQRVAARSTLIFSGLLGVVRGDEAVPYYRVPAKATLPGCGVAATFWRPVLDSVVPSMLGDGPVLDLRSSDYAAMWRPRGPLAEHVVTARVLSPKPAGGFAVISYNSKLAKGRLAAALIARVADGGSVRSVADVCDAWLACGGARSETSDGRHLDLFTA